MRLLHHIVSGLECLSEENIVQVGHITHFFSKIGVAVVELNASLAVGDRILVKGPSTDFEQVVGSIQIWGLPGMRKSHMARLF